MLLNTLDTRYKLAYMWPIPRRFGVTCTYTYLRLIKIMIYVHVCFGAWMHSYFRMFGQIAGTRDPTAGCKHGRPSHNAERLSLTLKLILQLVSQCT